MRLSSSRWQYGKASLYVPLATVMNPTLTPFSVCYTPLPSPCASGSQEEPDCEAMLIHSHFGLHKQYERLQHFLKNICGLKAHSLLDWSPVHPQATWDFMVKLEVETKFFQS
ncbi:hypothetical protein ROHU_025170 [Labeo rohita]|uniref:Uncharacterized protein n=1 Tax=Labeo rohita TaxID=84645 RepID=A0A498MKV6_LABRO|nr:hypothetical protein ROHU_025170 [Labeo rohita]